MYSILLKSRNYAITAPHLNYMVELSSIALWFCCISEKNKIANSLEGPADERLALHIMHSFPVVKEHVEMRPIFNPLQPGIEQVSAYQINRRCQIDKGKGTGSMFYLREMLLISWLHYYTHIYLNTGMHDPTMHTFAFNTTFKMSYTIPLFNCCRGKFRCGLTSSRSLWDRLEHPSTSCQGNPKSLY